MRVLENNLWSRSSLPATDGIPAAMAKLMLAIRNQSTCLRLHGPLDPAAISPSCRGLAEAIAKVCAKPQTRETRMHNTNF